MSVGISQLNEQQRLAVTTVDRDVLVLAGAGTGKTGVITRKIAWLVDHHDCPAEHIVAVTFTNKAASEMKSRLQSLLAKQTARQTRVSTFHRLGLQLLYRYCRNKHKVAQQDSSDASRDSSAVHTIALRRGFSIFDQSDSSRVIRDLFDETPVQLDERQVLSAISQWKNDMIGPDQAQTIAGTDQLQVVLARFYTRYQSILDSCNAVDFDDLIRLPVELLQNNHEFRQNVQDNIRFLLVDEYQDTNSCQYELVKLLLGDQGRLTAVGDDDQSIYAWRGANPDNLPALSRDFAGLDVIKLEQNYRSCQRVLRCANAVISENPHLYEKRLWSELGLGEKLRLSYCRDSTDEAEWVASDILAQRYRHQVKPSDIAILYRSNFQSRPLEQALRDRGINYTISGGSSFFDAAEVKDVLAYLRVMANPDDNSALLRIINRPRREVGARTIEHIGQIARQHECSLFEACLRPELNELATARGTKRVYDFANLLVLMADNAMRGDIPAVVSELLEQIDYDAWLADQSSSPTALQRARDNVADLLNWITRLDQPEGDSSDPGGKDFAALVAHMSLMDTLSRQDKADPSSAQSENGDVQMMTLHAAKGLEFPHVYLIGAEEGILPHHASEEEDRLEEERRLAYVGMTRAKFRLTFTTARTRSRFGEISQTEPSRFLNAIPVDDIEHLGTTPSQDAENRNLDTGRATLASLQSMLQEDTG